MKYQGCCSIKNIRVCSCFLYFLSAAVPKPLNQMQTLLSYTEDLMIWMEALLLAFKLSLCMTCCFIITFCIKSYCPL